MKSILYVGHLHQRVHSIREHEHPCYEFVLYTEGTGTIAFSSHVEPFAKGDAFVIPPHTPHAEQSIEGFRNYHFTFSDWDECMDRVLHVKDTLDETLASLLGLMHREFHMNRPNRLRLVGGYADLIEEYLMAFSETPVVTHPQVQRMVESIIAHYANPDFDLLGPYQEVSYHSDYFRKMFQDVMNETPKQYLLRKRLFHAKYLLDTMLPNAMTLKAVALDSGYRDYYYFSRLFKHVFGCSPKTYAQSVHQNRE